jgi:hypothetical protein
VAGSTRYVGKRFTHQLISLGYSTLLLIDDDLAELKKQKQELTESSPTSLKIFICKLDHCVYDANESPSEKIETTKSSIIKALANLKEGGISLLVNNLALPYAEFFKKYLDSSQ